MDITIHAEQERYLRKLVDAGVYKTMADAVQHALFLLEDYHDLQQVKLEKLRAMVKEGLDQADRGELLDGEEVFRELRAKNLRKYRKAE